MDWISSLTPESAPDPFRAVAHPPEGASIVEIRADLFNDLDLRSVIAACPLPVLLTLRSTSEGGRGPEDQVSRGQQIRAAWEAGPAMLDLEYTRDLDLIRELGIPPEQIVLSWHDHDATPGTMVETAEKMSAAPARWIKIVPTAKNIADIISVIDLHRRFNAGRRSQRRLIAFAMGTAGVATRYLGPLLGPPLGYAAWSDDAPAAPGQLPIQRMDAVIGHLDGAPQRLYGVVGEDVSGSLSPALHAAAYRELGLPYIFLPISVANPDELDGLFTPRGSTVFDPIGLEPWGWAVTTPYKGRAAAAADRHAPRVLRAAAANTVILGTDHTTAENTDADGVVGSLVTMGVDPRGRVAIVQGTGGAARGAAVGLHLAGADVVLRSRSNERAASVSDEIEVGYCDASETPDGVSILVNATPLGSEDTDAVPFSNQEISTSAAIVDMVYRNGPTPLAVLTRELGVPFADGREVLLHQGIAQFAAFTQTLPPKEAMRAALELS